LARIYTLCPFGHGTFPNLLTDDVIPGHGNAQLTRPTGLGTCLTSSYAYVVACLANLSRLARIYTLCPFGHGTFPNLLTDDVIPGHGDAQLTRPTGLGTCCKMSAGKRRAFCHSVRIKRLAIFICFPP